MPFIKAGSDITITPSLTSGTKIGTITVDGASKDLYAPSYSFTTGSANGTIAVNGNDIAVKGLGSNAYNSTVYLPLSGGTMTGDVNFNNFIQLIGKQPGNSYLASRDTALLRFPSFATAYAWVPIVSIQDKAGDYSCGVLHTPENTATSFQLIYNKDSDYNNSTEQPTILFTINSIGNANLAGSISSAGFVGNLSGNAATATYATHLGSSSADFSTSIDGNTVLLRARINGIMDWAIARNQSNNEMASHFYDKTTGNWVIGRVFLDTGNYSGYALPLSGGTLTGALNLANNTWNKAGDDCAFGDSDTAGGFSIQGLNGATNLKFVQYGGTNYATITYNGSSLTSSVAFYGAVWNDYAEYRHAESIQPGRVVREDASSIMKLSTERLMPACEIISDTFGFAIGETDNCKTPIACTGRVLAYIDNDRNTFNIGDAVCSGANGTVSVMTREEIREYPDRIIGYVSEIPTYETWGTGNVKVDGRIWIRVR